MIVLNGWFNHQLESEIAYFIYSLWYKSSLKRRFERWLFSFLIAKRVPSRGLIYPTLGKGKSSSKCHFGGYVSFLEGMFLGIPFLSQFFFIWNPPFSTRLLRVDVMAGSAAALRAFCELCRRFAGMGHSKAPWEICQQPTRVVFWMGYINVNCRIQFLEGQQEDWIVFGTIIFPSCTIRISCSAIWLRGGYRYHIRCGAQTRPTRGNNATVDDNCGHHHCLRCKYQPSGCFIWENKTQDLYQKETTPKTHIIRRKNSYIKVWTFFNAFSCFLTVEVKDDTRHSFLFGNVTTP